MFAHLSETKGGIVMKKIAAIVFLCLAVALGSVSFLPAISEAQPPTIQLPDPQIHTGRPLMEVLRDRSSERTYSTEKLPP